MRKFLVTITGTQPLLLHYDDIEWADRLEEWRLANGKKSSKAGDDRSPPWRWIGSLYHNEAGYLMLPRGNLMRALMEGAAGVLVPGARYSKTFKAQSQSGILPCDDGWPLLVNDKPVAFAPIAALMHEPDFKVHQEAVRPLGFSLFLKRARIGQSKHVRVRPRFDQWGARGELEVVDDQITESVLTLILDVAGRLKGLCDWRPSSPTPGTFGMFSATVEQVL
jgi:hypothetical protein